jgi:hypothetical protein
VLTFDDVLAALDELERAPPDGGAWPIGHCAQSIEYAVRGFPRPKPWIVRVVVGPLVLRRFLAAGAMSHDVTKAIDGADDVPRDVPFVEASRRLRAAIAEFRAASSLRPHFVYGAVPRDAYERVQAMHVADHVRALRR